MVSRPARRIMRRAGHSSYAARDGEYPCSSSGRTLCTRVRSAMRASLSQRRVSERGQLLFRSRRGRTRVHSAMRASLSRPSSSRARRAALPESLALYPRTKRVSAGTRVGIRHSSDARRADTDAVSRRAAVQTASAYRRLCCISPSGGANRIGVSECCSSERATGWVSPIGVQNGKLPPKSSDSTVSRNARQEDAGARCPTRAVRSACSEDSRVCFRLNVDGHVQISSQRRARDRRASSTRPHRQIQPA